MRLWCYRYFCIVMGVNKCCFGLCVMLICASGICFSQSSYYDDPPKAFEGGLIAGLNFTQIDGDTYFGYHKVGLQAGGVVYVHFTKKIGATMELLYSQKGSRGEDVVESPAIGTYVTKYFMNVNYVEVPLTFHIISHKFDFEVGACYARLISSKEWIQSDQPVTIDPEQNKFNSTDVDYIFGMGHRVYKQLYANIRFEYSVTSIRSPGHIPVGFGYGNEGQFNNLFSFRLMYMF
jgi:Outer membrane protein beta-barrel domain